MTSGKRAALDRLYYPLLEATKALKTQGINLSVYDLLHYGVKGRSRFFVHVPAGIRVCPITNLTTNHDAQELKLLILSKLCCGEIECNREADESDFPSAYASLYSSSEYPQQHHNNNDRIERMYWRTIDANGMTQKIRITPQAICITANELSLLKKYIDSENDPPAEFHPKIDEHLQKEIELRCYSVKDALKMAERKIDGFTEIDLFRYGYYAKLSFLTPRPANLKITASEGGSDSTIVTNQPPPDMLVLYPEDCFQIEIFGQTIRSEYKNGFLCKWKTLIPYSPKITPDSISEKLGPSPSLSLENHRLRVKTKLDETRRWRTWHESKSYPLEIRKDNLYLMRSEFDPLIEAASKSGGIPETEIEYTPAFTISEITKYNLSPKKFASLSELAKLAKCSESLILSTAADNAHQFFTPVPCEIALCQAIANSNLTKISHTRVPANVREIPQLLVIDYNDCETVVASGHHKQGAFKLGYSFENNELVPCYPNYSKEIMDSNQEGIGQGSSTKNAANNHDEITKVWLTFYQDKPIEIDITFDRIFIELTESDRSSLLADVRKILSKRCSDQTSFPIESGGLDDPIDREIAHHMSLIYNQSSETGNPASVDALGDRVTVKEFMEMAGISRTTITNRTKRKDKYPDFPTKFDNDEKTRVFFRRPEVDAWIRKNPHLNRKRKQNKP